MAVDAPYYARSVSALEGHFTKLGDRVNTVGHGFHVTRELDGWSITVQVVWSRPEGLVHFSAGSELGVIPEPFRGAMAVVLCHINAGLPVPGFVMDRRIAFRTSVPLDHSGAMSTSVAEHCVETAMSAVARNRGRLDATLAASRDGAPWPS